MCVSTQHLVRKCPKGKQGQESAVDLGTHHRTTQASEPQTCMVRSVLDPTDFLYSSDSDDGNVCMVRLEDKDSCHGLVM